MGPASQRGDDTFLAETVSAVPGAIVSVDETGTIVFATGQVDTTLGYSADALTGQSIEQFLPAEVATETMLEWLDERADEPPDAPSTVQLAPPEQREQSVPAAVTDIWQDGQQFFVLSVLPPETCWQPGDRVPVNPWRLVEDVCEQSDELLFLIDPDTGAFELVNERACEVLGYERETLSALDPAALHADEDAFESLLQEVPEEGTASTDAVRLRTAAGDTLAVTYSLSRIERGDSTVLLARAQPEASADQQRVCLSTLGDAIQSLLTAHTDATVTETAVEVVRDLVDCQAVSFWQPGDRADADEPALFPVQTTRSDYTVESRSPLPLDSETGDCFQAGVARWIDLDTLERDRALATEDTARRFAMPVGDHGLLTIDCATATRFDDEIEHCLAVVAQAVAAALDRLDRERELGRRTTAMAATTDGTAIVDEDGEFVYVNDAYADMYGYETTDALLGESWHQLYDEDERHRFEWEVLPTVREQGEWHGEAVGQRVDGSTVPQELSLAAIEDGELVWTVRDITDRKSYQEQLAALNDVHRDLTRAETAEDVARTGLETLERLFGFEVGCVRFFDADANALETVAMTDRAAELVSSCPAFDLESTLAGRAYRREEIVHNEWAADDPFVEADVRGGLHLPLGEHGVLTICTENECGFDELETALAEALAASFRAALDRATREQTLRANKQQLREQHERLDTLHRITELVQEIGDHLIEATTRTELERTICTHIGDSELYQSAWIGAVGVAADRVDVRVGAGVEDSYLDVLDELPLEMLGSGTVAETLETGEIQVVKQYETRDATEQPTQNTDQPVEATAAVPLAYGERIHGVLVVNGVREDVFSEDALAGFASLGKLAGFALTALQNREILLSDAIVELELHVADESLFASALSEQLDCECRFERSVPIEDGRVLQYDLIQGVDPAQVLEFAEDAETIESAKVILEQDDGIVFQTITDRSLSQYALQAGASLQSATAENGTIEVTLEAPQSADVREIVDAFDAAFEAVDVVAKREREHPVQTATEFRKDVAAQLTEKQRAALEAAYAAGYYEWPREVTAEELAESMGISSSTLHQHLRYGVQSLAEAFFQEPGRDREDEHAPES